MRRLEFLLCGSPNDAFWSQIAMFRLSLDSIGPEFRAARVVMCVADDVQVPLPERWQPHFTNIEVEWAPLESYLDFGDGEDHLFTLIDPEADVSCICDADTLFINPPPDEFFNEIVEQPAICGAIAHLPPPKFEQSGRDYRHLDNLQFWQALSREVLGREIELDNEYTLKPESGNCPFYINYGFVASTPALMLELHRQLSVVQPAIRQWLDNDFFAQLGITLAVERGNLATRTLPMRYNFPNDPRAEQMFPEELLHLKLIHYLRRDHFDRHLIFSNADEFNLFMELDLEGSNRVFQEHIKTITHESYPF